MVGILQVMIFCLSLTWVLSMEQVTLHSIMIEQAKTLIYLNYIEIQCVGLTHKENSSIKYNNLYKSISYTYITYLVFLWN